MAIQFYQLERMNNPLRKTALSFNYLAKLNAVTATELGECQQLLGQMLECSARRHPVSGPVLIVGMVESGVILSALLHQEAQRLGFNTFWICSTRRPASGLQVIEHHSHAPKHILPLPDVPVTEVWIVEDEITTGRTIVQVAHLLGEALGVRKVRVFALADTRTPAQQRWLHEALAANQMWLAVHTLFRLLKPQAASEASVPPPATPDLSIVTAPPESAAGWHLRHLRPALQMQGTGTPCFPKSQPLRGCLLVIGEALDLAVRLLAQHPGLALHHVTLSPWQIDHQSIFDRLHVAPHFYLYNLSKPTLPLAILGDPIDTPTTSLLGTMLTEQGYTVTTIIPRMG